MLSTKDVAAYFGVSVPTIFRWRENEYFPAPLALGKQTVRFREDDIRKFEGWLLARAQAEQSGQNPDDIPTPDYSLPMASDVHAMARERLAASTDPESELESRLEQVRNEAWTLTAKAAILASKSKPGQLSEQSLQRLRDSLPSEVADTLLDELPFENAQRLREILQ